MHDRRTTTLPSRLRWATALFTLGSLSLLAGCPDREVSSVTSGQAKVEGKAIPTSINRKLDLLFVIDNSGSMGQEQKSLTENFPAFINVLKSIDGGLPDVHIGVVTSDMGSHIAASGNGDNGVLRTGGVTTTDNKRYLASAPKPDNSGTRDENFTGDIATVFTQMANAGTQGSGFEQHLAAARKALDPATTENAGFLREDAFLAIIIIADEDDCSQTPGYALMRTAQNATLGAQDSFRCTRFGVTCDGDNMTALGAKTGCKSRENSQYTTAVASFVTAVRALKKDPDRKIIVAGITGPGEPFNVVTQNGNPGLGASCSSENGNAVPAIRLNQFFNGFKNSTQTTICKKDLSEAMQTIGLLLKAVIGSPCFDAKLAEPLDCVVSDVAGYGTVNAKDTLLSQCNAGKSNTPCWSVETDTQKCPAPATGKVIKFERGGVTPPNETMTKVSCVTEN